ncbi:MAG TPA: ABC transporter ATP-binding protein [Desulfobacterales bacterium]|nr:ABC transporter ATP-binding protein [Desulfobacterales bacterium]
MLLNLTDIVIHYQKVAAVQGISLRVEKGQLVTLLGSNGAGKSTTLRTISGLVRPSAGEIRFDGKRIDGRSPDKILKLGIAHVPEGRRVFPGLTVLENLYTGAYVRSDKEGVKRDLEKTLSHFPVLKARSRQVAKTMSGGEQQMLAIGRALMSNPRLLMLDEPSLGLAPLVVQEIARILTEINRKGVSVILVEQNAEIALNLAHYGYVLETGRIALHGKADELKDNEHVRKAYLGI